MNESTDREPQKKRFPIVKSIFLVMLFLLLASAALISVLGIIMLQDITQDLPDLDKDTPQPSLTSVVYDRKGRVIARLFEENRTWLNLDQMSPWTTKAILAAEDSEFYEHQGIRLTAIMRALMIDISARKARHGGSTITQQVARMLFLSRERTLQRKASEAIIAMRMERKYTKDQILELYMNMAYFGHGAYGIGAASQVYFGKAASQLTLPEASMLAGVLPAPNSYTPVRHPDKASVRQDYVLSRMVETGIISPSDKERAKATKLQYIMKNETAKATFVMKDAPYFVSYILFKYLLPKYGRDTIYRGGLKIYTTIDLDVQEQAEKVVSKMKHEGALVALDPETGEILALVGGRDFEKSKFNRAVQAYRQPGSAFKPIVFAAAMENGHRPVDHIIDAPLKFPNGWSPRNSDLKFSGEITLLDALSRSVNTSTVRLAQIVGIGKIRDQAKAMGITTPYLPEDLSLALGSASLSPLEMAVAFSSFANNGFKVEPYGIKEILDSTGHPLEQNGASLTRSMSPEVAVEIRSMLIQAVSWGTGTRASIPSYQTFGKTGTTNDFTDAWFIGGVPGLVAVVYVGNDNHKTLGRAFGGTVAAPAWKEFVQQAVKTLNTPQSFTIPPGTGVESVRVCRKTGFLASGGCPSAEILMPIGQAPGSKCPWHGGDATAARNDPNAPLLVLAPIDDGTLLAEYQLTPPWTENQLTDDGAESSALQVKPPTPGTARDEAPVNPNEQPYRNDPTPAQEVEKRFQDLLKQYNIKGD